MSIEYDGATNYVSVADAPPLRTTPMTVVFWAYFISFGADSPIAIVSKWGRDIQTACWDVLGSKNGVADGSGGMFQNTTENGIDGQGLGAGTFVTGVWYLISATFDSFAATAAAQFGVNGVTFSVTGGSGTMAPTTPIQMAEGARATSTPGDLDNAFNGRLEDIRIYNRVLTHDELKTIFVCQGSDTIYNGLVYRARCSEGPTGVALVAAGSAPDVGPNAYNGDPVASPLWANQFIKTRRKAF